MPAVQTCAIPTSSILTADNSYRYSDFGTGSLLPDWTTSGSCAPTVLSGAATASPFNGDSYSINLNGNSCLGAISSTFATYFGKKYRVSVQVNQLVSAGSSISTGTISVTGVASTTFTFNPALYQNQWQTVFYEFTAACKWEIYD